LNLYPESWAELDLKSLDSLLLEIREEEIRKALFMELGTSQ